MDSVNVPIQDELVPPDFQSRFALSLPLTFRERISEQLYSQQEQWHPLSFCLYPLFLSAYSLLTFSAVLPAAVAACYAAAAWKQIPGSECIAAVAVHMSLTVLEREFSPAVCCLCYCGLGTLYSALVATWRKLACLTAVSVLCRVGSVPTMCAALALIYCYEWRQRELWRMEAVAKCGESQALQLLASQSAGLVVCDFSGRILYQNSSAGRFLAHYSHDSVLSPATFSPLFRQVAAGISPEVQLPASAISAKVTCAPISWFSRNCVLVSFAEISDWLQTVGALSCAETKVLVEVATLERDASRKFRDTSDPSTQLQLCRLHRILQEANAALAVQRFCSSQFAVSSAVFSLRTEVIDSMELSSLCAEHKSLVVELAFAPDVPAAVAGDKVAVGYMLTYLYCRTAEASRRGTTLAVRVAASASDARVKIEVAFEFTTANCGKLDEDLATVSNAIREETQVAVSDANLTAFLVMLQSMRGDCSSCDFPSGSQSSRHEIRFSFYLHPEKKLESRLPSPISSVVRQELSTEKFRWDYKADPTEERKVSVRKRYVKRHGQRGKVAEEKEMEELTPCMETSSSELFLLADRPVDQFEHGKTPAITHHRTVSMSNPSSDIPGEAAASPPANSLVRHPCDLGHISPSVTAPFPRSLLSSRSAL